MSKIIKCGEFTEQGITYRVTAYLELVQLANNKYPYFAVTGHVDKKKILSTGDFYYRNYSTGCCHKDILKTEKGKELKDIIRMHLSNINGEPSSAFHNGWWFLHGADEYEKEHEVKVEDKKYYTDEFIADHLRVPIEDIPEIRKLSKEEFKQFVEEQKPRWKKEADEIIKKYKLTIEYH